MLGLDTYNKSTDGVVETYSPKDNAGIQIVINTSNKFVTIKSTGRKDKYDRLKPAQPIIAELDRLCALA